MKRLSFILLFVSLFCLPTCATIAAAQTPQATEFPGQPFSIRKTWNIGGEGNWDYLTLDPDSLQLYIAHGTVVQVVDVNAGNVTGQVTGMREAHDTALDDHGQFGYVTDGGANRVRVFNRRTLDVVASIPAGLNPRSIVYEPSTHLVFAVSADPISAESHIGKVIALTASPVRNSDRSSDKSADQSIDRGVESEVTVINADSQTVLATLILPGHLGFAQTDGKGQVFINITDRNEIAILHANAIEAQLRGLAGKADTAEANTEIALDLSGRPTSSSETILHRFRLGSDCQQPRGLAVDSANDRLFATCDNMKMQVLNANTGEVITTLPIGAGNDAIGYDAQRGFIYAANGGGVGSLTIIRQHVSDSYAVVQELPTRARARTLAINPSTGEVYLVTNAVGLDLTKPGKGGGPHSLPVVDTTPVKGSFQVLVVGN